MRIVGMFRNQNHAQLFGDYLYAQGIDNKVDSDNNQEWNVWVASDDHMDRAKQLLTEFISNPDNPKYLNALNQASQKRQEEHKSNMDFQKKVFGREQLFRSRIGTLTVILIVCSVVVTLLTLFGENNKLLSYFTITSFVVSDNYIHWKPGLPEIFHGQVWRLITPIFIHYGILHIIFNMLWLNDLGSMIEGKQKSWYLAMLVLVIGILSNLGQYFVSGPMFGGMSGVVYGLFGYVWLRGKYDLSSGYFMHPQTVIMMIVWFFLCLFGIIPHVANTAHAIGFGIGCAWGFISAKFKFQK
jgi:GlpG protein